MEMNIKRFTYEEARILILQVDQSIDELIHRLTNFEVYQSAFLAIKNDKRKKEFLGVRIAMNILTDKNVIIDYDENQKPFLCDESWKISISHSQEWVAVIAHPEKEVGIDIECRTSKVSKVYKRYLNDVEQGIFFQENNTELLEIAWSAKEVLYKIIGKEALDFARQLHLEPFSSEKEGVIRATQTTNLKAFNLHYIQNNKFTMVYCIDKK
jgi:phosphopantetheinyl transferase